MKNEVTLFPRTLGYTEGNVWGGSRFGLTVSVQLNGATTLKFTNTELDHTQQPFVHRCTVQRG